MTWRKSFGTKLVLLLVLLVVVPLFFQGAYSTNSMMKSTQNLIVEKNAQSVRAIDELLTYSLETDITSMENLSSTIDMNNIDDLNLQMVEMLMDTSTFIYQVYIMDETGMQVYKSSGKLGDRSDRGYFQEAMRGNVNFSDVIISGTTGEPITVLAVPIEKRGKVVGVLGASLDLASLYDLINGYEDGRGGYAFIVDSKGIVIAHPDETAIKEQWDVSNLMPVEEAIAGNTGDGSYVHNDVEKTSAYTYQKLTGWGIISQKIADVAFEQVDAQIKSSVVFLLAIFIIAGGLAYWLSRSIIGPIKAVTSATETLSLGDLTVEVDSKILKRKDEFGTLGNAVQTLATTYKDLIGGIQNEMVSLEGQAVVLSEISEQNSHAIDDVAQSAVALTDISNVNYQTVQGNVAIMQALTATSVETMESAGQLSSIMNESAKVTGEGIAIMEQSSSAMTSTYEKSKTISGLIDTLSSEVKNIESITETIKGISDQTNLLALNAAIEAARAGDAGRGFAVVAEEIRKLAEESAQSAEQIASIIATVVSEFRNTNEGFGEMLEELNRTVDSIDSLKEQFTLIEVRSAEAKASSDSIALAAEGQSNDADKANEALMELMSAIEQSNGATQNISASVEEQAASTEQITEMVENLTKLSGDLLVVTKKFEI